MCYSYHITKCHQHVIFIVAFYDLAYYLSELVKRKENPKVLLKIQTLNSNIKLFSKNEFSQNQDCVKYF